MLTAFAGAQFKVDANNVPIVHAKRRALVVGAANYASMGKLTYPISDAQKFRDALVDGFKFSPSSVTYISDAPDSPIKPTSSEILGAIDKLLADPTLDKGDLFIFYFSGHGIGKSDTDYLCMSDSTVANIETTGVPVAKIVYKLRNAGLRNILFIADACRAGDKSNFGTALNFLARKTNIAVLLGCEPGNKSYESPTLRSGVYTYFLLKALSNPKNRTEFGGLWASKVASNVESLVFEYTKHDYGDNAQKPDAFADPTSDVLLAKYVPDDSKSSSNAKPEPGMVKSPEKMSDDLTQQIDIELAAHRVSNALEVAKQAVSLNPKNYEAAYLGSFLTVICGRTGETEKMCDLLKASENPYYHGLGFVMSESRRTPIAERLKALEAFWDSSPKDGAHGSMLWNKARTFAPRNACTKLLRKMLQDLKPSRFTTFIEAEVAYGESKFEVALDKYRAAAKIPDQFNEIRPEDLTYYQLILLYEMHRTAELKQLIDEQLQTPKVRPRVWVICAVLLRAIGEEERAVEIIKKRFSDDELSDDQAVMCAEAAPLALADLAPQLEALVKLRPYSWKLQTILALAKPAPENNAWNLAQRYSDNALELTSLEYAIMKKEFDEQVRLKSAKQLDFSNTYFLFWTMFLSQISEIGNDSEKWCQILEIASKTGKEPQAYRLLRRYITDLGDTTTLDSQFYESVFRLATVVLDDDLTKLAAESPSFPKEESALFRLDYVGYLASRGKYAEARVASKALPETPALCKKLRDTLDAILKAEAGDKDQLKILATMEFGTTNLDVTARGLTALMLADKADADTALKSLEGALQFNFALIPSIRDRAIDKYLKLLKTKGQGATADGLLFSLAGSGPLFPYIRDSYFGSVPNSKDYAGKISLETEWFSEIAFRGNNPAHVRQGPNGNAIGKAKVDILIDESGKVSGTIAIHKGETVSINGEVDIRGNLVAEARLNGTKVFAVEAKMVGREFRQTDAFKKADVGTQLFFTNADGIVTIFVIPASAMMP